MKKTTCRECTFFNNNAKFIEDYYSGLNALSSAWGCVRGDAGLCGMHDVYLFPRGKCGLFKSRTVNSVLQNRQKVRHASGSQSTDLL